MIKGIIFDMDGIMFDTERLGLKGWKVACEKYGYKISNDDISNVRGRNLKDAEKIFKQKFGDDFDFYEMRKIRIEYSSKYIKENGLPIKKGLLELLEFLKLKNYKTAIATSTGKEITMSYLNQVNITDYFEKVICGDMVEHGKPNPDIYLKACSELNLNPENCMVLEDSISGLTAAIKANCKAVAIPDLDQPSEELCKLCFSKVNSLLDVINLLDKYQ